MPPSDRPVRRYWTISPIGHQNEEAEWSAASSSRDDARSHFLGARAQLAGPGEGAVDQNALSERARRLAELHTDAPGADDYRLVADAVHAAQDCVGLAVNSVEDKRVGARIAQADELRAHVLVGDVEGLLADERNALRLGGRLDVGHGALTPACRLEHKADLLGLATLEGVLDQERRHPALFRRDAEHPFVLAALPFDDAGAGRDHAHPRLAHLAHHSANGERVRRAITPDHDDAVVAVADAASVVDGARGFALVVIGDHAQLLAEHTARLVDLVDGGIDADLDGSPGVSE